MYLSMRGNKSLHNSTQGFFFCPLLAETFGLIAFPKIKAYLFSVPKTIFISIRKQLALNFFYHESSIWQLS